MSSAAAQKASTKSFQIFSTFAVVDPTQPNLQKTEKSRPNPTITNPTQPNPWVNPTHGQLCYKDADAADAAAVKREHRPARRRFF